MATERKKLDGDILALWSLCIRTKQKTCRSSNSDYQLTAHHIIEKNYRWGRYALENGLCLSFSVHCLQKAWPEKFRDIVIGIVGQEEFKRLKEKYMYQKPCKRTITELRAIKEDLKAELKRLEADWGQPFDPDSIPF